MRALLLLICLLVTQPVWALSAQVDRNQLARNETLQLVIEMSDQDGDGEPDLAPLKKDFEVLGSTQSQQIQIVNGERSASRRVIVNLAPKREGSLTIPPLRVGSAQTQAIAIKVTEEHLASAAAGSDVFLEVEIDEPQPYVQAQVVFTVRVHTAVSLEDASLSDIDSGDLLVQRLGDDVRYRSQAGGRSYQVIERRYGLFPQTSGAIEIPPIRLNAQVPDNRRDQGFNPRFFGSGDPFQRMFGATKAVSVASKSLLLNVRARPADAPAGPWLPARAVLLREDWAPEPPEFKVGEPVTRTLTVIARGLTASQLPEMNPAAGDDIKTYPDQPTIDTTTQGVFVIGRRIEKQALIPSRSGQLTLPAVELAWWNTVENKAEIARLPERQVEVLPAATQPTPSRPQATPQAQISLQPIPAATNPPGQAAEVGYWPWISAALGAFWLLTLLAWWRTGSTPMRSAVPAQDKPSPSLRNIEQACKNQAPAAARKALLAWARQRWPEHPPAGPQGIGQRLGDQQALAALLDLERQLYRDAEAGDWDGKACWEALRGSLRAHSKPRRPDNDPLPALYPAR